MSYKKINTRSIRLFFFVRSPAVPLICCSWRVARPNIEYVDLVETMLSYATFLLALLVKTDGFVIFCDDGRCCCC